MKSNQNLEKLRNLLVLGVVDVLLNVTGFAPTDTDPTIMAMTMTVMMMMIRRYRYRLRFCIPKYFFKKNECAWIEG
jgi:hypothetical protein